MVASVPSLDVGHLPVSEFGSIQLERALMRKPDDVTAPHRKALLRLKSYGPDITA